jgi:type IV secretory pathway VirD2 relaxase
MTARSFERLLKSSRFAMPVPKLDALIADRTIRLTRPDREKLDGKVSKSGGLSSALGQKLKLKKPPKKKQATKASASKPIKFTPYVDNRQRAVAKIHYFNHAGGGAAALAKHGKYIARDAGRDGPPNDIVGEAIQGDRAKPAKAHADYLERKGVFYDKDGAGVDGAVRLEQWAKSDLRHFRIILSAEEGGRLRDLPAYTREVMARAGAALGTELSWVAVDHKDTDNPHTHIVVRGRRSNGQDLVLPRDFIKHGFRGIAQDAATEWLGKRTPEQERLALDREVRRHGLTRLDTIIDGHAPHGKVDMNSLLAPNLDPALTQAAKARVQELARMGLGEDRGGGLFQLAPDWCAKLKAMDFHLDIRKRVMRNRVDRSMDQMRDAQRGMGKGFDR